MATLASQSISRDAGRLFDLSGKVALITGGSRGLGLEMALAFAAAGADVVLASRKAEACEAAAAQVREFGRRALSHACHVGDWSQIDELVHTAYARMGKVDILVNNAGMSPLAPSPEDTSEDLFDKIIGVNFKGPFRLTAKVASRMAAGEGGSVINVSSVASLRPNPEYLPYAAAKSALNTLTEGFAKAYAPKVRVNAIIAGPFLTDIAKAWTPEKRESYPNAVGRPANPYEILTAALYLASPNSSFSTGSLLRCDGGVP